MAIVVRFSKQTTFSPGMYVFEPKTNEWFATAPLDGSSAAPTITTGEVSSQPAPVANNDTHESTGGAEAETVAAAETSGSGRHLPASFENTGGRFGRYLPEAREGQSATPQRSLPLVAAVDGGRDKAGPGNKGFKMTPEQKIIFHNTVLMTIKDNDDREGGCETTTIFKSLRDLPYAPRSQAGIIHRLEKMESDGFILKKRIDSRGVPAGYYYTWSLTERGIDAERLARKTRAPEPIAVAQ